MTGTTRVGVEVGGTFTDLVAFEADGVRIAKVPSTPSEPHRGAVAALDQSGLALDTAGDLVHGSTVATNAVLERKGARVAFLATEGFRDILVLQRQSRRSIYDIHYRKPAPVVPRRDTFEIPERMGPDGEVVTPLDEAAATDRIRRALDGGDYESVAICFLNSYANPVHERRGAGIVAERFPGIGITCSCDVTREFREYERASTTVLAAYVQPVIDRYLTEFERELDARSFRGRFSLMQSNGGRLPASGMTDNAITSLFSGPAAGVMGAIRQAERSGYRDLVTFDMGGTSTDVCLVRDGVPILTSDAEIDGLPIRTPVLDIVTVGAGGGSIVWRDDGGMLRVGPQSAGAEPGPACYRRGGTAPTITDAHVIRGTVLPDTFLGGRMGIDSKLAREAFGALSAQLGRSVEQTADDAVRVAEHNIVRAIQLVSTERGRDPRDYVLVPFGGAGPLHAARVAEVLSIGTIVIPPAAGVLSAFGLVASDFVRYESRTVRFPIDEAGAADRVREQFAEMRASAVAAFEELGIASALRFTCTLEMRYVGQAFEVPVLLGDDEIARLDAALLRTRFNEAHHRIFEFDDSRTNRPEIVSFRLGIASPPPSIPELAATEAMRLSDTVAIFDAGERRAANRIDRRALLDSDGSAGPLLIGDDTSTAYVPPGWRARVDAHHNVILSFRAEGKADCAPTAPRNSDGV
ncbi:MAG: hydantoinase/oxoprolinase family protein [Thiotrichales bacterium]|nr:hydantoinase/oxoprolinase family protein [Thiotrichales bacterium]